MGSVGDAYDNAGGEPRVTRQLRQEVHARGSSRNRKLSTLAGQLHPMTDEEAQAAIPRAGIRPDPIAEPVFLVGAERSGSTLLRLMLDHHPEIAFEHEFDLAVDMVSDDGGLPPVEIYHGWVKTVRGMEYRVDHALTYLELVKDFLGQKRAASGGKKYVGATVHHHFDRLQFLWPRARFIHLVRDPRDVARSVVEMGWAGNVYHGVDWWTAAEACWDSLASRLSPGQFLELRYEELVACPEA